MFLDPRDFETTSRTMEDFREWAGEIANSYFNAGAMPTEVLTKIARQSELTPHQIEVLAAEAAEFPLADARLAISHTQMGEVKVAAEFVDPVFADQGPTPEQMFGVAIEPMDKTAGVKHDLRVMLEKAAAFSDHVGSKLIELRSAHESASVEFIKAARHHMLDEANSAARMKVLGLFDHFVKAAGVPAGKKLLAKVAYVLQHEGKLEPTHGKVAIDYLTKEADCTAPAELISDHLPAKIVNGDHPLYITLKTIGDMEAEIQRYARDSDLVSDKVRILKQKIRAL
jgi:hypothetical protein